MATTSYGSITVIDTNDIDEVYMVYRGSDSNTEAPPYNTWAEFNNWVVDATQTSGQYIWQLTVITKSGIVIDENNFSDFIGQPVCITSGRSIVATITQFTTTVSSTYNLLVYKPNLLTDEPDDWETNWSDYYYYNENTDTYESVPGETAPEFETDTYYDDTWETQYSNYYYYDDETGQYEHVTGTVIHNQLLDVTLPPTFEPDTYYELVPYPQTSVMEFPDDVWSDAPPEYNPSTPTYWVRVINTFDQEPKTEYVYYRDNSLTDAMAMAYQAYEDTQSLNDAVDEINDTLSDLSDNLSSHITNYDTWIEQNTTYINSLNTEMAKYLGSIIIDETVPSITLTSSAQGGEEVYSMEITSAQLNLKYKTQITAYISGQTFRAPEGSFSDIVMTNGETGDLRWIARSNGHLSLKVVK